MKNLFQPDQPYYPKQKFTFRGVTYEIGQHIVIPAKFTVGAKGGKRDFRDGGYFPPNAARLTAERRKKERKEKLRAAAAREDDVDASTFDDRPPTSASSARDRAGRGHRVPSKPRDSDRGERSEARTD